MRSVRRRSRVPVRKCSAHAGNRDLAIVPAAAAAELAHIGLSDGLAILAHSRDSNPSSRRPPRAHWPSCWPDAAMTLRTR